MIDTLVIVTAVIGGIDQPKEIPPQTVEFERKFYTHKEPFIEGNDRMQALWYKCNLIKYSIGHGITIWVDGKIQINSSDFVEQILQHMDGQDIAVLKHGERACIYQEVDHIEHCMRKGNEYLLTRYSRKPIRRQVEAYRYFGYPANNGLNDCCIIAVRNNDTMQKVFAAWWQDVYDCDGFDQTALQFHCWQAGVKINPIIFKPGSYTDTPHAILK